MPGVVPTMKHIAADIDLVAVHWQASSTPDDEFSGQAVMELWRLADGQVVDIGFDPRYIQHNPGGPNGTETLKEKVRSFPPVSGLRLTVMQSLADQDLAFAIRDAAGGSIGGDIFRVLNGKIIEHWDVNPPRPPAQ